MTQVGVWPALGTLVVLFLAGCIFISRPRRRLPPGPRGWPIVGNMLSVGPRPHVSLFELSKQYGPLMLLRLGQVKALVVTSPEIALEVLKTHDQMTAERPIPIAAKYMSYGGLDIGFSPPGEYWRYLRKIANMGLLSQERMKQYQELRGQETLASLHYIVEESQRGNFVNMNECLALITMNNICQMVISKTFPVQEAGSPPVQFPETIRELVVLFMEVVGSFNIADYFPFLTPFDPQGLARQAKDIKERLDRFFVEVINEHLQSLASSTEENSREDFLHTILKMEQKKELHARLSRDSIKAILMNLISGGADTSSNSALWVIVESMRHPHVLRRIQEELHSVVGSNRLVQEGDLPKLKYLGAVIKETYRLHPSTGMLGRIAQDCEIQGFHVPAKTQIYVNIWGIHRNPDVWERPLEFDPDRFLDSRIDIKGQDFQFLPFGSGRRICPGINLGSLMVVYMVAFLLHALDFSLPEGQKPEELDISEKVGVVLVRKLPLLVSAKARLPKDVIYPAHLKVQNGM